MGRDLEDSSSMVERTLKDAAETCEKHFVVLKENNRGVVKGNEGSLTKCKFTSTNRFTNYIFVSVSYQVLLIGSQKYALKD